MKITFNQAQKAIGHLSNNNNSTEKPPLLTVKGWDKSKVVYQVKSDIETAFKTHIDRFKDLLQERQNIQQEAAALESDEKDKLKELTSKVAVINDEIKELLDEEVELKLSGSKFTEEEFGDVIDSEIYIDLNFAIELNGEDNE